MPFSRCPKCAHRPLPAGQALPAACPACGVILAKVVQARRAARSQAGHQPADEVDGDDDTGLAAWLLHVPDRVDAVRWWLRAALLAGLAVWGLRLSMLDHRSGEIGASFLHSRG